jgi:virginiamycin A acetyltransferase
VVKKLLKKLWASQRGLRIVGRSAVDLGCLRKNRVQGLPVLLVDSTLSGVVTFGEGCSFNQVSVDGTVEMGRCVSITGPGTRISSRVHGVKIGSFCSIGSNVTIQEHNHRTDRTSTYFMAARIFGESPGLDLDSKGPIEISDDVWIGSGCTILSGVSIGRGAVIGAGSVVTRAIPPYSIAVGNPARVVRQRFSQDAIARLEETRWWTWPVEIIRTHRKMFLEKVEN